VTPEELPTWGFVTEDARGVVELLVWRSDPVSIQKEIWNVTVFVLICRPRSLTVKKSDISKYAGELSQQAWFLAE
jgi:hypothetical protein